MVAHACNPHTQRKLRREDYRIKAIFGYIKQSDRMIVDNVIEITRAALTVDIYRAICPFLLYS